MRSCLTDSRRMARCKEKRIYTFAYMSHAVRLMGSSGCHQFAADMGVERRRALQSAHVCGPDARLYCCVSVRINIYAHKLRVRTQQACAQSACIKWHQTSKIYKSSLSQRALATIDRL